MEEPRRTRTQQASPDEPTTVPPPRQRAGAAQATRQREEPRPTGWVGWVVFAGIGMILLGCFQAMMGLVGIFNTDFYLVTADNLAIPVNYTAWGWFHLIMGVVVFLAGIAVLSGKTWGRVIGIALATLQALVNFAWFPAYPLWSAVVITIDVLVIYALAVHGGEMKALNRGTW